ncbi:MAG: DNA alkylation repair protein [Myxococcota bacterium]
MTTPERKRFKDWFDEAAANAIGDQIQRAYPDFAKKEFLDLATANLNRLEMMERVKQWSDAMAATLPPPPESLRILTASLPAPLDGTDSVTDGYLQWPVGQYIADHAVDHFEPAMTAMIELTQRLSSEFAVRPFVERYPEATFNRLLTLTSHENPHVRRWCSEGIRPRLPWGRKLHALIKDPNPIWPILEALKDDDEPYVRKSVANVLNDIAKDHPAAVVERGQTWSKDAPAGRAWIIKHGLRSLVKAGHPGALAVVGFDPPKDIAVKLVASPMRVAVGGTLTLEMALHNQSKRDQALLVDYAITFMRKAGPGAPKVFKGSTVTVAAGQRTSMTKRHVFRQTTIRRLYPGPHQVAVQVNGVVLDSTTVELIDRD